MIEYPIRVLKKKLSSPSNVTISIDNFEHSLVFVSSKVKKQVAKAALVPVVLVLVVLVLVVIYTQVVSPLLSTKHNKLEYQKLIDSSIPTYTIDLPNVVYNVDKAGRKTATVPMTDKYSLQQVTEYLSKVKNIEEVLVDKTSLVVTFYATNTND